LEWDKSKLDGEPNFQTFSAFSFRQLPSARNNARKEEEGNCLSQSHRIIGKEAAGELGSFLPYRL